jgi:hypothetical protein
MYIIYSIRAKDFVDVLNIMCDAAYFHTLPLFVTEKPESGSHCAYATP